MSGNEKHGFIGKRLQLLLDITGSFRQHVLTSLIDVVVPAKQYFLMFLLEGKAVAPLKGRLKLVVTHKFIEEIMETVELYAMKDALVGIPGVSGLSTKQHPKDKTGLDASAKLTRAKLNKCSEDADLSKDKSGPESPLEFLRSWRQRTMLRRNQAELELYYR
ncbi:hypothetical protein Tco_0139184 [Tanacetum coccineum]